MSISTTIFTLSNNGVSVNNNLQLHGIASTGLYNPIHNIVHNTG